MRPAVTPLDEHPDSEAVPVDLDAPTSSGDRCNPSPSREKGSTMLNQLSDVPPPSGTTAEDTVAVRVEDIPTTRDLVNQRLAQITAGDITATVIRAVERVEDHWNVWHYVDLEFDTVVEGPERLEQIAAVVTEAAAILRTVDAAAEGGGR